MGFSGRMNDIALGVWAGYGWASPLLVEDIFIFIFIFDSSLRALMLKLKLKLKLENEGNVYGKLGIGNFVGGFLELKIPRGKWGGGEGWTLLEFFFCWALLKMGFFGVGWYEGVSG